MRALQFMTYGGPEVLVWAYAQDPHACPGQMVITVQTFPFQRAAEALSQDGHVCGKLVLVP